TIHFTNMKVRINATGDTIVMKFVRPSPDVKLEGYILGYGSSMFSKQFIQLPENGKPYETEMDAEPKYLVAVQPIPANDVKKHCTGKVNLEKPLHLVIGSISPTAVLLSWGNYLKTPYEGNIMKECLEDGFYTIRYRERNRKWTYQTCPTSDTVIDNLKPNTPYEFGVRSNKDDRSGMWSKLHTYIFCVSQKPPGLFPPRPAVHNRTHPRLKNPAFPGAPRTSFGDYLFFLPFLHTHTFYFYLGLQRHFDLAQTSSQQLPVSVCLPQLDLKTRTNVVKTIHVIPQLDLFSVENVSKGLSGCSFVGISFQRRFLSLRNGSLPTVNGQPNRGISPPKPALWSRPRLGKKRRCLSLCVSLLPHQLLPQHLVLCCSSSVLFPFCPSIYQPIATRQETWEDSDLFKSQPTSEIDAMGKKRYVAPHVVYQTGKKPDEPCSITSSLNYFPEDEPGEVNVTAPPKSAPSNLTVVTVEGCPSFIILDWEKSDNDTTEYEVISTAKGPDGEQVSILTTNQTHTAVENLKPESSYEFKVKPKNELGKGPSSEPVSFNTESADPRVSENVSGKDAIWTQFPFKTDSYSDCHGKQYVKRTWYRKFVGVQLCNSLRYKIYLSDSLNGKFYNIGDQTGFGEDHCQFVDSFLDGRTGRQLRADQLPNRPGFYRAVRQEPVHFGPIGGHSHINYVSWYECGTPIPGKW
uniref:Fibronectin type-III domain-containing protein n=1 Tax=Anabas testudineus TaxID=64144 RepID=A0A3Q1J9K7_ANATE